MAQDRPNLQELFDAVRDFIASAAASGEGESRFNRQVSSYLLGICQREVERGDALDAEAHRTLADFLGHDGESRALLSELCSLIRTGKYDDQRAALSALVKTQTLAKARITRPDHLLEEDR